MIDRCRLDSANRRPDLACEPVAAQNERPNLAPRSRPVNRISTHHAERDTGFVPRLELHARCAGRRLPASSVPPSATGIRWSIVIAIRSSLSRFGLMRSPQMWHHHPSRAITCACNAFDTCPQRFDFDRLHFGVQYRVLPCRPVSGAEHVTQLRAPIVRFADHAHEPFQRLLIHIRHCVEQNA